MTAAQLSQLTYQGAGGSTVDTVQVRVNDGTVLSSWTSFAVTVPLTIESFGVTSLVQVGNNYFLNPVAGGTGPELNVSGSPVVTGEYSGWTLIGAEQTSTGYDVAWKNAALNSYAIWTTDSSGNFVSNSGAISGTSTTLENFEVAMQQDLNGDGVIGVPPALTKSVTASSLPDNFQFANDGTSGMIVQTPAGHTSVVAITPHDTFVFAPNFGQSTIDNLRRQRTPSSSARRCSPISRRCWQEPMTMHPAMP